MLRYLTPIAFAWVCVLGGCGTSAEHTADEAASSAPVKAAGDALFALAIKARLTAVDLDSTTNVQVSVSNGRVTLSGAIRRPQEREKLVEATRRMNGVDSVSDELRLNGHAPSAQEGLADAALTARVIATLAGQAGVNAFAVHVTARSGIVTLHGTVPTSAIKSTLIAAANGIPNVRDVVDEIQVH